MIQHKCRLIRARKIYGMIIQPPACMSNPGLDPSALTKDFQEALFQCGSHEKAEVNVDCLHRLHATESLGSTVFGTVQHV